MTQAKIVTATTSVLLAVTLLTSCSFSENSNQTEPTPAIDKARALSLVEEAYAEYNYTLNQFNSDPENNREALSQLVSSEIMQSELETAEILSGKQQKLQGETNYYNLQVDEYSASEIISLVCADMSQYSLVDSQGNDITSPDLPKLIPFRNVWSVDGERLVLKEVEPWSDHSICF